MEIAAPVRARFMCALQNITATTGCCTPGTYDPSRADLTARLTWDIRYFPKDEPSDGLGHRHDWEGAIVWLNSATSTSADNIVAVCPSAHGGWDCTTDGYTLSGTQPLIEYTSDWPVNHATTTTTTIGGTQPLVAWESLPSVAQSALQTTDFGSAIVPIKDATFTENLAAATF